MALTCGFYDGKIIADPCADEELLLSTTVSTVLDAEGRILGVRPCDVKFLDFEGEVYQVQQCHL